MKKLLSLILLLSAISVGCLFPTFSAFAMTETESSMTQAMEDAMSGDMGMHSECGDTSENLHECCMSPYSESFTSASNVSKTEDESNNHNDDIGYFAILNEDIFLTSTNRLNAPPDILVENDDIVINIYTALIGIIKNNV